MVTEKCPHPRIAVFASAGIGGTEKAATIYAVELARRGYTIDYLSSKGPRSPFLEENGVRLIETAYERDGLRDYLREASPAIVHQHVPGYRMDNPLYPALKALGDRRPKVIETNVFGRLEDPGSEPFVDFRCFISAASAAQALSRARLHVSEEFFERQTVLYYPVATAPEASPEEVLEMRGSLQVEHTEVLAVRIGRPSHKWARWECEAFQRARRDAENLRLLLMEPPEPIWSDIAKGRYGPGIVLRRETPDFDWLGKLYRSSDLTIHASDWGESFGYTIAEAMATGHPVITRSTPWGDNAQTELVESGVTGYVCQSVPEMSRRLADLARDPQRRQSMGEASRIRIAALASVDREIDLLEEIIDYCLTGTISTGMKTRGREAYAFVRSFPQREYATSESTDGPTLDSIAASSYELYRRSRSSARALLNRLKGT